MASGRARKYVDDAARARAYRLRKKLDADGAGSPHAAKVALAYLRAALEHAAAKGWEEAAAALGPDQGNSNVEACITLADWIRNDAADAQAQMEARAQVKSLHAQSEVFLKAAACYDGLAKTFQQKGAELFSTTVEEYGIEAILAHTSTPNET